MYARRGLAVAGVALLLACQDSAGPAPGLSLAQLAGTWDLSEFKLLLESDTTVQLDLKAATDLTATLAITAGGATTLTVRFPNEAPDTVQGTIVLQGDTLVYSAPSTRFEYRIAVTGRSMTWLALYTDEFADLNDDGSTDETREWYRWLRR
jgi:autotransporter translocation and assembly factor TamB